MKNMINELDTSYFIISHSLYTTGMKGKNITGKGVHTHNVTRLRNLLILCFCTLPGLSGFSERDITLVFPSPIKEGDDLKLMCMFTKPRNATIDSVKW